MIPCLYVYIYISIYIYFVHICFFYSYTHIYIECWGKASIAAKVQSYLELSGDGWRRSEPLTKKKEGEREKEREEHIRKNKKHENNITYIGRHTT